MSDSKPVAGRKYEGAEAPHHVILGSVIPVEPDEVGGRGEVASISECPKCHALNHIDVDPTATREFECWRCNSIFFV